MEGKSSASSNLIPGGDGGSYSFLGLQGSMQVNQHQNLHSFQRFLSLPEKNVMPLRASKMQETDQPVSFLNFDNKVGRVKISASDDDGSNVVERGVDGKKEFAWHRVKWTDEMVKLLITAVSYIGDEATFDFNGGGRTSMSAVLPKKGKWKSISKVMDERGYHVSPQQCEDKFNDLNKRYKRLNDILGRGTSGQVVENPTLLDSMDLSEKAKDDVRKILSSKQLFYKEMCSYHNKNRLYLPHDQALQQSLQLALISKDNFEHYELTTLHKPDDLDEEDQDSASDDRSGKAEEGHAICNSNGREFDFPGVSAKRKKREEEENKVVGSGNALNLLSPVPHPVTNFANVNQERFQNRWMMSRSLRLEEQKLKIQAQMLELERQRLRWYRVNEQEDMELEKMRMENERMKLKNERLALEIKRREMGADYN
ncbi:uncharacterized protein LOC114258567 [Camellia sinensis]|nr:uncharacterized protein LOC114258567 [Camellia sinensis]